MKFANLVARLNLQSTLFVELWSTEVDSDYWFHSAFLFPFLGPSIPCRVFGWIVFILGRLLASMWRRFDILPSSHNHFLKFVGILKLIVFACRLNLFFSLQLQHCESQRADTFLHHHGRLQDAFSKNISFDDPQNGVIFDVENRCRM